MTRPVRHPQARALQGHWAGFVSRIAADAVDLGVIWTIGLAALLFARVVRYLLTGPPLRTPVLQNWLDAVFAGPIGALLALPAAASIQALVSIYAHRYEVVASPLVAEQSPHKGEAAAPLPAADSTGAQGLATTGEEPSR